MARKPLTSDNSLSVNFSQTNSMMRELYTRKTIRRLSLQAASGSISNGDTLNIDINVNSTKKRLIHTGADIAIYVGSVAEENLLLPYSNASTQDLSDWQFIGPFNNIFHDSNYGDEVEPSESTLTLIVRNISAGTVTLVVHAKPRVATSYAGSAEE